MSAKRQELTSQSAYDTLFADYEKSTLAAETQAVDEIASILKARKRIALLCYEKLPQQCHRTRVVNAVLDRVTRKVPLYTE